MNGRERIGVFAAALWWGSLGAIGFLAVPLLFVHPPETALAGRTAARLFQAQAWVSIACGMLVFMAARTQEPEAPMRWARGAVVYAVPAMLLALLLEFAVAPRIVLRENLALWHSVGSAMYLAQWLCAGVVLWKVTSRSDAS